MEYKYRIYEEVYNNMITGKKTVEFRLLNDKAKSINIGDNIKFIVVDNDDKYLMTEVLDKYIYEDIDDLWNHKEVLTNAINYTKEEFIKVFNQIFGEENVKEYKIVGFKIRVINNN